MPLVPTSRGPCGRDAAGGALVRDLRVRGDPLDAVGGGGDLVGEAPGRREGRLPRARAARAEAAQERPDRRRHELDHEHDAEDLRVRLGIDAVRRHARRREDAHRAGDRGGEDRHAGRADDAHRIVVAASREDERRVRALQRGDRDAPGRAPEPHAVDLRPHPHEHEDEGEERQDGRRGAEHRVPVTGGDPGARGGADEGEQRRRRDDLQVDVAEPAAEQRDARGRAGDEQRSHDDPQDDAAEIGRCAHRGHRRHRHRFTLASTR